MYQMFTYYGVNLFKNHILVEINEMVANNLEDRDHSNIWKVILYDILSSFLKTSTFYHKDNEELYNECFMIMYDLYEKNAKPEIKKLYRDSIIEGFIDIDPLRFDKVIRSIIEVLPCDSAKITENNLEIMTYLMVVFNWRFIPYLELMVDRYLDCDPKDIKISANYESDIPLNLRILFYKNWPEILVVFVGLIHMNFKTWKVSVTKSIQKIYDFVGKATEDLRNFEVDINSESDKLILNNSISNLCELFKHIYKSRVHDDLDMSFVKLHIEISNIAKMKGANNDTNNIWVSSIITYLENSQNMNDIEAIREYSLTFFTHENWRVRENSLILYEIWSAYNIDYMEMDKLNFEVIKTFFDDENVYVLKQARHWLCASIWSNFEKMIEIVEEYKVIWTDLVKEQKVRDHRITFV